MILGLVKILLRERKRKRKLKLNYWQRGEAEKVNWPVIWIPKWKGQNPQEKKGGFFGGVWEKSQDQRKVGNKNNTVPASAADFLCWMVDITVILVKFRANSEDFVLQNALAFSCIYGEVKRSGSNPRFFFSDVSRNFQNIWGLIK